MSSELQSTDLEYVYDAAVLSNAIYNIKDKPNVDGFNLMYYHDGSVSEYSVSHWCIFMSECPTKIYIVFRGSFCAMDLLTNLSVIPLRHPSYHDVDVHSGYFTEIEREYEAIKTQLTDLFANLRYLEISIQKIVITGHSKGGALSQLLLDKLFHDEPFCAANPCLTELVCITFSAPMVYWFRSPESIKSVISGQFCHNFIIRGDIVPVLYVVLSECPDSFYRMYERYLVVGVVARRAGIRGQVEEILPYMRGFKPVGHVYTAVVTKLNDLHGVTFRHAAIDKINLGNWDCVKGVEFSVDYHWIKNHIEIAKNDYESSRCLEPISVLTPKGRGFYVQNNTEEDVLFVMSHLTPLHWARIPGKKTMYVSSGLFWFNIKVSKYNQNDEPTRRGVAAKIGGLAVTSVGAFVLPGLALVVAGSAAVHSSVKTTKALSGQSIKNPGKDCLGSVYADGRTIVVDKLVLGDALTDFFELSLVASESSPSSGKSDGSCVAPVTSV